MGLAATVTDSPYPPQGTITRVLRRYDIDPTSSPPRYSGYKQSMKSIPAELHGVVACTLFFRKGAEADAHKASRLGWKDETLAWQEEHGGLYPYVEPRESKPAPRLDLVKVDPMADAKAIVSAHLESMDWNELRQLAKDRGLKANVSRVDLEAALVDSHFSTPE